MKIFSSGITDRGCVRQNNEDNIYLNGAYRKNIDISLFAHTDCKKHKICLFAVCDGMGGEHHGEVASLKAIASLDNHDVNTVYERPELFAESANRSVCNEIEKNNGSSMGATLSVLMIENKKASICHVGDSRIYLFRKGQLTQLSKDHTRAQQMVDLGIITEEQAKHNQMRHVLTQHLGVFPDDYIIEPQIVRDMDLQKGDMFLLCSDGLTDMVEDHEIHEILSSDRKKDVEGYAVRLKEAAYRNGGKDNVSVIVVKVF